MKQNDQIFPRIAVLGAGTIGQSWTALFAATGRAVCVYDPSPDVESKVLQSIRATKRPLQALGWQNAGDHSNVTVTNDPIKAVRDADFIQENAPERIEVKHELYRAIERDLNDGAIIGSSTSGIGLSALQAGLKNPGQIIIAHPFNPPHLIPLVELMANTATHHGVLDKAQAFYEGIGKICVRLQREIPGHIANRLQAALWRETIHLAMEGVASIEDIDRAVTAGPGLRWSIMGPNLLFHLGGGSAGIRHFCEHLGVPVQSWWNDLGVPDLTPDVVNTLASGLAQATRDQSYEDLVTFRDSAILRVREAINSIQDPNS